MATASSQNTTVKRTIRLLQKASRTRKNNGRLRKAYGKRPKSPEVRLRLSRPSNRPRFGNRETDFGLSFSRIFWCCAFSVNFRHHIGDIILYDGRLAVYKHSLDLIFYLIANQDENELMVSAALSAFSDAVHMLLRNQVEKRAVLENLDLVLLCLDETIDEGYVTHSPASQRGCNNPFSMLYGSTASLLTFYPQYYRGNRFNHDRFAGQPAQSRHDRDRHQRADDHERISDDEGEDDTTDCRRFLEVPPHSSYVLVASA